MKYQILKKIGCYIAVIGCLFGSSVASAEEYKMTLAGASPGGLWALIGAGVDQAVKAEYPGSTITYQTSGGGIANVALLSRNDSNLAIIHDVELQMANRGRAPFIEPITNLRTLCYLYTWAPMQAVMSKSFAEKYGITNFSDIAKVKPPITITVNKRGNVTAEVALSMLEAIGATQDEIESWGGKIIYAASGEQTSLMQDRRADLMLNGIFVGHRAITQIASSIDVTLLSLSEDTITKVSGEMGVAPFTIPANAYSWEPEEVKGVALGAALVVREDMDEETAYNLTKALFSNYQKISAVHNAMKALTPEVMASLKVVPYHDGAKRYLKESGLM